MSTIPSIQISPAAAAQAYARNAGTATSDDNAPSFADTMVKALDQAAQTGHTADQQAMQAIAGNGNLTDVVTALSHAEMTLQTATAIRDRVVQAYQDIMKMPI